MILRADPGTGTLVTELRSRSATGTIGPLVARRSTSNGALAAQCLEWGAGQRFGPKFGALDWGLRSVCKEKSDRNVWRKWLLSDQQLFTCLLGLNCTTSLSLSIILAYANCMIEQRCLAFDF